MRPFNFISGGKTILTYKMQLYQQSLTSPMFPLVRRDGLSNWNVEHQLNTRDSLSRWQDKSLEDEWCGWDSRDNSFSWRCEGRWCRASGVREGTVWPDGSQGITLTRQIWGPILCQIGTLNSFQIVILIITSTCVLQHHQTDINSWSSSFPNAGENRREELQSTFLQPPALRYDCLSGQRHHDHK